MPEKTSQTAISNQIKMERKEAFLNAVLNDEVDLFTQTADKIYESGLVFPGFKHDGKSVRIKTEGAIAETIAHEPDRKVPSTDLSFLNDLDSLRENEESYARANVDIWKDAKLLKYMRNNYLDVKYEHDAKESNLAEIALLHSSPKMLETVLEEGCSPDIKDENGNSLIHLAVSNNRIESLAVLLNAGVKADLINARNNENKTPLMLAVATGDLDTVKFLHRSGADFSHASYCYSGDAEMVNFLKSHSKTSKSGSRVSSPIDELPLDSLNLDADKAEAVSLEDVMRNVPEDSTKETSLKTIMKKYDEEIPLEELIKQEELGEPGNKASSISVSPIKVPNKDNQI